jgi:glycosyltransferase involved in cell wall biosynthesis
MSDEFTSRDAQDSSTSWLVVGMGSYAYGKERRAVTALKYMSRIRPHFLTTVWEDGTVSDLLRTNKFEFTPVTIGYLGRARLAWTLKNVVLMPRLFLTVLRVYRQKHCCGVLILALQPFANLLPVLWVLKMFYRSRMVFYLGDIPANSGTNRALCHTMNAMADAIIVNSEAVRRGFEAAGVPISRMRVIYNGVVLEKFEQAKPFPWREQFGWGADKVLVGFAGQFSSNKGVIDFIDAAEQVLRQEDRCRFVIIGKIDNANEDYRKLAAHIRERKLGDQIVFTGWIDKMERAYASLDIMVVPSRHEEPAANVIIEAMASGLPVIATRTGGSPELLNEHHTGFLVETTNPAAMAERILQLAGDYNLRAHFRVNAREMAARRFDASKNALLVQDTTLSTV